MRFCGGNRQSAKRQSIFPLYCCGALGGPPEPEAPKPGSSLFPMEWLVALPAGSRAKRCPGSGPLPASRVSATHPNPAWRPKQPSLWPPIPPILRQTLPRAPPESPRSTSDLNQRYYGETPVGLRRYERAAGDTVPPLPRKQRRTLSTARQRSSGDCPPLGSAGYPLLDPSESTPLVCHAKCMVRRCQSCKLQCFWILFTAQRRWLKHLK